MKIFQILGLISLALFSFFITEKTATVVSDMDEIMIEIKNKKDEFKSDAIDAVIDGDTIIPGISGKEVNIKKSYKNMKSIGYYNDELYIYDYILPNISISDNMDKYILKGNPKKRMISLIFTVKENDVIEDILKIIDNYNIKATFFVEPTWFTNNNNLVEIMIKNGHNISTLLDDYNDSNFDWIDMVIKKIDKQRNGFCYITTFNKNNIDICKIKGNYTIMPTLISNTTPLLDVKNKLESGSLLSFNISSKVVKELSTIIIYIKSKGYKLVNLEENILE